VVHEKVSVVEDSLNPRPQGWLIFGSLAVKDCLKGAGAGLTRPGGLGQGTSDLQVMRGNLRPLTADLQATRF